MTQQTEAFALFSSVLLLSIAGGGSAWGASQSAVTGPVDPDKDTSAAEKVSTENIKEKYWARGKESELGVVQNRLYSKAKKFEFSVLAGVDVTDPMLSVYTLGGRIGYHFSEYFSLHLLAWKAYSSPSSTQTNLLDNKSPEQVGTALNTNDPRYYVGTEAQWSLLYGKLSLLGKAIIHYDFHLMLGIGDMSTQSGSDFEQHVGVGQQFFLSKRTFFNVDYRLVHYHETILQQVIPTSIGQPVGTRENFSSVITVGIGFLFGAGEK